jgi:TolA-binding protein
MKKKRTLSFILIFLIAGFFFAQHAGARSFAEDEQLISVGTGAFRDGFYDIAEKQFSNFVRIYPKHEKVFDIYYLLGRTFFIKGKLNEAKAAFSKIIREGKNFENMDSALLAMAQLEAASGNQEEASKILLSLIKRFPKCEQIDYAYYLLGLLQTGLNQLEDAESTLKKVSQNSKNDLLTRSSYFWLGILAFRQKEYGASTDYFQNLWENPKSVPSQYLKYALFWLGESQLKLGRINEAKSFYQTFQDRFKNDPLAPDASWRIGFCEYQLGDVKHSIETLQSLKNRFRDSPLLLNVHSLLGKIFLMNGDHLSSIKELNFILNSSQGNNWAGISLLALYWNYIQLGDDDGANRIFQRLQKLNHFEDEKTFIQWLNAEMFYHRGEISESLPYYFNILNTRFREKALSRIGKAYFFEDKYRESVTNLDILFLEFPNSRYTEEGLFVKAECLAKSGNLDEALEAYELLLRRNSNNPWRLFALTQVGGIYSSRNQYEKAERAFKEVMENFPHDPLFYHAALQLGNLNFSRKNVIEAVHYYSIVLKGNILELFGEAYFGLGEAFYQEGRYEKALHSFEKAIQYLKSPSSWFFLTHLEIGNLKRRGGEYDEAKKSYLIILDQSKDEEIRKAARDFMNRMEPR